MPMVTPPGTPTARRCRRLRIPDQVEWLAAYNGQIADMLNPAFWEQIDTGDLTPEQAAAVSQQVFFDYLDDGDDFCMAGRIFAWVAATPPKNALLCNGQLVNASDYPALDELFGHDGSGKIHIPDMRARFLLATGQYPYSSDPDDDLTVSRGTLHTNLGGHTLTVSEMPAHNHTDAGHTHSDLGHTHGYIPAVPSLTSVGPEIPQPTAVPGAALTALGFANISSGNANIQNTGGGSQFDILPRAFGVEYWMSTR